MASQTSAGLVRGGISAAVAAVLLGSAAVDAATINYGNFPGATVNFQTVNESSTTDPVPLYGAPDGVADDQLAFDPSLFGSSATNGSSDITDGLINFIVDAKPGYFISDVNFTEFGDYTLAGNGTVSTSAIVGQSIFVEVLEIDDVTLAEPIVLSMNSIFNPSNGDYFLPAEAGIAKPWFGVGTLDIEAELLAMNIIGSATRIEVSSNNTLVTTSENGTVAFIQKKDLNISSNTQLYDPVPEPATLSILALGATLMLRRRMA
jgi:hypothetical protein